MIKEYKLKLNNKEYNIEIEEENVKKEEINPEKFEKEWEKITCIIFPSKRKLIFILILGYLLPPFIFVFFNYFRKTEIIFGIKVSDISFVIFMIWIFVFSLIYVCFYWSKYIPKKLEKIINNTENNKELKEKLEKIFKEKIELKIWLGLKKSRDQNIGINEKVFDFYKLLIQEKFMISKEENYKKILEKLDDSIGNINKKSSTIVGYISNNFIKSFCGAMIMANVNAFYCAYYSNVKDLSYENFIKNIVFFVCMIGLGIMLNYFIMDYYKPTIKEIEKKKKCIESIWKEN